MKKIKFELDSWEKGRNFMKEIASKYNQDIEERGQILKIEAEEFSLSCNLDMREFSFLILKLENEDLENDFETIKTEYQ